MGGEGSTRQPDETPQVPSFFTPQDLPDWLRADPAARPPASAPPDAARIRAAWATAEAPMPQEIASPFQAAADTTWRLVAAAHPQGKTPRRGTRARNRSAAFMLILAMIGGWLATLGRG